MTQRRGRIVVGLALGLSLACAAHRPPQTPTLWLDESDRLPTLRATFTVLGASEEALAHRLADEGYFDRCADGERKGCALFVQLVAARANPSASTASWGRLSTPG